MDLFGDTAGLGLASGLGLISSLFSFALFPLALLLVALVLYYFTGEKKRADDFMPRLMAQVFRIFDYTWLFIISVVAFVGTNMFVSPIVEAILPDPKFGANDDFESKTLVKGIVLMLLMLVFGLVKILLNRRVQTISGVAATVTPKVVLFFGLVFFSVLSFMFTIASFMNVIDYFYETDLGIDAMLVSLMLTSMAFTAVYVSKSYMVLKRESK
jgi:MFS family permease